MMATMSLQAAYDQARTYLEANRVDAAIGVAQHILTYFPENLEAHRILGEAYLAGREFNQAETAFKRVLHSDPENIPAHVGLGITYERQGKLPQAIVEFEQALEVRPDMPELRNQLLRLYTDVWGAENATLRLSRPGLARLYAKGHMLPQAIQEFRGVIDEMPERFDARIGLAEALWRDGQEDGSADVCAEVLQLRPDALKANLLLGYARISAGDPSGEPLWQMAQQLDPYQGVARALFDTLPDLPGPDLNIPEWDETIWAENQARERAEQEAQVVAAAPAAGAGAAGATFTDDDFFSESWAATPPEPPPAPAADDDDFLANLLAFDSADLPDPNEGASVEETGDVTPFDFDNLDSPSHQAPAFSPAETPADTSGAESELTAFSLEELGLSDEEIAALNETPAAETAEPAGRFEAAEPSVADELEMMPFSLEDLGLSDEEIAALNETPASQAGTQQSDAAPFADEFSFDFEEQGAAQSPGPESAPADEPLLEAFSFEEELPAAAQPAVPDSTEPELTPFSFADLGLSEEEIAALNAASAPGDESPSGSAEPELSPFSLEELGLSADEISSLDVTSGANTGELEPFSLDDLDLDDLEQSTESAPGDAAGGVQPFDWGIEETAEASASRSDMDGVGLDDLQPFSLDDLDLNAGLEDDLSSGSLPSSLQPFSLDDVPPRQRSSSHEPPSIDAEDHAEGGAYSWQQPSAKRSTDFLSGSDQSAQATGPSIFAKLRQRSEDMPREEEQPLPPVTLSADEEAAYFSNDNVSLRNDDDGSPERLTTNFRLPREGEAAGEPEAAPTRQASAAEESAATDAPTAGEPELTPFSLEELSLSPDEIAALQSGTTDEPPLRNPN
ncbi:MAG: tetratricopeptide repeat protein [Blastochloris sp.]|nr:tetratricopeptide repeat protein [Blastochloris sp.]